MFDVKLNNSLVGYKEMEQTATDSVLFTTNEKSFKDIFRHQMILEVF
jgi:hypothetical protein